jgi:F0F1-type ATP synthase assembly protein I
LFLIYLSIILFFTGLCFWIAGAVLHKKAGRLEKKEKKNQQQKALFFGTIAKIILVIAALICAMGVMMIQGAPITQ